MNLEEQVLADKADEFRVVMDDQLNVTLQDLSTIHIGYSKPFYWMKMPDGKKSNFITRGKFTASLAVLRMNYPYIKFVADAPLPAPKQRRK